MESAAGFGKKGQLDMAEMGIESMAKPDGSIGWLIYRECDYKKNLVFADRMVAAAASHGLALLPVMHEAIRFGVSEGRLFANANGVGGLPSFAIQRAMDPFLAGHLEKMGVRLYNRSAISAMCNDKAWTYQVVAPLGVPMLPTWFADRGNLSANYENKESRPSYPWPVVVKSVGGRGGTEVNLAMDSDGLIELAKSTLSEGRYVIQPLCGRPGTDIRVFVIGSEPIAAIRRESGMEGMEGFKANYSLGGRAKVHQLNHVELQMVKRIASAFSFDYVGIDFILDETGQFLFNEIEDAVGSRTLSMCTDIDIADLFLGHVSRTIRP